MPQVSCAFELESEQPNGNLSISEKSVKWPNAI